MICPGGMGRRLPLHSWGWSGQIDDLARMPSILRAARPWLRVDPQRVYAVGGSMGGQETLLLVGRRPQLLAGAVAFDSVTDFFRRYADFAELGRKGKTLQALARVEVGGTPASQPAGLPPAQPPALARARSRARESRCRSGGATPTRSSRVRRTSPAASSETCASSTRERALEKVTGSWSHTAESYRRLQLPGAVRWLGLVPDV